MNEVKKILSLGRAFWDSQVLLTSINLDLFEYIKNFDAPENIAKKLSVNVRGIKMLLDSLVALGFVEKRKNEYKVKDKFRPYLLKDSEKSLFSILKHYSAMWNDWGKLIASIKSGKPFDRRKKDKEESYHFINGMDNLTKFYKDLIIENIDFKKAKKLLDVGSGPATYLREMLKKNIKLKAVIVDLPSATFVAKEKLAKEKLQERVTFIEGSLEEKNFGKDYDIVLISQVLHSLNVKLRKIAIKKTFDALNRGGKIYIHEFYLNENRTFPKDNVVFCLNMLLHADGGNNLTVSEIKNLLKEGGFEVTKVVKFKTPSTVLIEGTKI